MNGFYLGLAYIISWWIIGKPIACIHGYYLGERYRNYGKPALCLKDLWFFPGKYFEDRSISNFFMAIYPVCILILAAMGLFYFVINIPKNVKNIFLFIINLLSKLFPKSIAIKTGVFFERLGNFELIKEK